MKKGLTRQEELFCRFFHGSGDSFWSAVRAGYGDDARWEATALLENRRIRERLERMAKAMPAADAVAGLRRIAFGSAADALRLLFCESAEELEALNPDSLDLYAIAEMKRGKEGGVELKLHNRMNALCKLADLAAQEEGEQQDAATRFLTALAEGERARDEDSLADGEATEGGG